LPAQQFIGDEQCVQVDGGPRISYEAGSTWSVSVGDSSIQLDASGLKLVSPRILFSALNESSDDSL